MTIIQCNIRSPHSFIFVLKGEVVSSFLTHKTLKITVVNKVFLTKRTPDHDESIAGSDLEEEEVSAGWATEGWANVCRELTLGAMAPYATTKPVTAQASAALGLQMMSMTAGVARPRTRW
jgi:hypothetical protein